MNNLSNLFMFFLPILLFINSSFSDISFINGKGVYAFYETLRDSVSFEGEPNQQHLRFEGLHIIWVDKDNNRDIIVESIGKDWRIRFHNGNMEIEYTKAPNKLIYSFKVGNDGTIVPSTEPNGFQPKHK